MLVSLLALKMDMEGDAVGEGAKDGDEEEELVIEVAEVEWTVSEVGEDAAREGEEDEVRVAVAVVVAVMENTEAEEEAEVEEMKDFKY